MTDKSISTKRILKEINANDAFAILKELAKDKNVAGKIKKIAEEYLTGIDLESIIDQVFEDLSSLDVEDLYDCTGSQASGGYEYPHETSFVMAEEVLEDYLIEIKKHINLNKIDETRLYGKAVIKGIIKYIKEGSGEFYEYIEGDLDLLYNNFIHELKNIFKDEAYIISLENIIKKNFS